MTYPNLHIEQLMFKKATGSISKAESELLEAELATNAAARAHYEDILQTLSSPQNKTFLDNYDQKAGWKQIESQVDPTHSQRISPWKYALIAAALILMVFSVWYYRPSADGLDLASTDFNALVPAAAGIQLRLENGQSISLDNSRQKKQAKLGDMNLQTQQKELSYQSTAIHPSWATLQVPARQDYLIRLPDGSKVRLNSMSSLRFPSSFAGSNREVYVQGEAYFTIAANAAQPFIVHTPSTSIRVLGTEFNVNTYEPGQVSTALVSGKIAIKPFVSGKQKAESEKQLATVLSPGKEAIYRPESGFETKDFEEESQLSWMKGLHYFYNETLGDISPVLARWYGVSVVFDHPDLAKRSFSGRVDKSKPLQDFIDNLQLVARISPYIKDNTLHFK